MRTTWHKNIIITWEGPLMAPEVLQVVELIENEDQEAE